MSLGDTNWDFTREIIQTNDGGYVIAGNYMVSTDGNIDALIIKYDSNGNLLWSKTWGYIGEYSEDYANSVIETENGDYIIVGSYASFNWETALEIFAIKFGPNGDYYWNKKWGTTNNDYVNAITILDDKSFVLAGLTINYDDVLIIKYDSDFYIKNCSSVICQVPSGMVNQLFIDSTSPSATLNSILSPGNSLITTVTTTSLLCRRLLL